VQVDAPPLSTTLLLIQKDLIGVMNVTEPKGFSLSAEVKKDMMEVTTARPVNSTMILPHEVAKPNYCNTSYSISNQ